MDILSILILQLILSFSVFIFVATRYVTPKVRAKDTMVIPFARSELEPMTREFRLIHDPINNCVVQGAFE